MKAGYGTVWWRVDGVVRQMYAHRVAWLLVHGELPDPAEFPALRHGCDFEPCCNVAHLTPGTQLQNMDDMKVRGRRKGIVAVRGMAVGSAKLTDDQVVKVRHFLRSIGLTKDVLKAA